MRQLAVASDWYDVHASKATNLLDAAHHFDSVIDTGVWIVVEAAHERRRDSDVGGQLGEPGGHLATRED